MVRNKNEISEEEKQKMFEDCLFLATKFIQTHQSGDALAYMQAREKVTDAGLDNEYHNWFFGVKSNAKTEDH